MSSILIIEDDPLISRLYQKAFAFDNYTVDVANDGEEGFTKIRELKPTIVLLDIMMPKINGLEVLKKIKQDPDLKKIPVIVLTNLSGEQDTETALTLGAVKYIVKSEFDPSQVVAMVKEVLAASSRNEVPQAAPHSISI